MKNAKAAVTSAAAFQEKQSAMTTYKNRFDFDIGYLVKSPCRDCKIRHNFPKCSKDCKILDKVQEILCGAVSSTRGFSSLESYALSMESWGRK